MPLSVFPGAERCFCAKKKEIQRLAERLHNISGMLRQEVLQWNCYVLFLLQELAGCEFRTIAHEEYYKVQLRGSKTHSGGHHSTCRER